MKFLWIGSFASDEMFNSMPTKSVGQASGFTSQRSLINGLDENLKNTDITLDTLNVQGFPLFPDYPQKNIERVSFSRTGTSKDISIGFVNTRLRRYSTQKKAFLREIKEWAHGKTQEDIHVFLYEPVLARLQAVKALKKLCPKAKCHLIVPDIPELVGSGGKLYRFLKKIRKKITDRYRKYVDDYILYSAKMADYYHIPRDKYIVMEGSIDPKDVSFMQSTPSAEDTPAALMYSGAIVSQRAIPAFLDAFAAYGRRDVALYFSGGGNVDERIHEMAKTDERITHFGFLKTREEVLALQMRSTALLHIRDKNAAASDNCFPSKLFEYMVSGKPVLSVRIGGIPEEYYEYLIEIKSLSPEDVAQAIDRVLAMTPEERTAFGQRARNFILENKNAVKQTQKMLSFALR